MQPDDPRHGEERGYFAHRVDGETPCDPCRRAHRVADAQRILRRLHGTPTTIGLMPAQGARRRIEALNAIGWPNAEIANKAGWSSHATVWRMRTADTVRVATAQRLYKVYDELHMTPGPSELVRRKSTAAGFAPPLAWNNIDDDPHPDVAAIRKDDRQAVARKVAARPRPPCGTERGYQWHRARWRRLAEGLWPLPPDDPCGCRSAHRTHEAEKKRQGRNAA